jgi:hypothetical protein
MNETQIANLLKLEEITYRFNQNIEKLIKLNEKTLNQCKEQLCELHEYNKQIQNL